MRTKKMFFVMILALLISALALTACGPRPGGEGDEPPNQEAVDAVILLIDAIPSDLDSMALASDEILTAKAAYEAAYAAYSALTTEEKALISPDKESKLSTAKTWYDGIDWSKRAISILEAKIGELYATSADSWGAAQVPLINDLKTKYQALTEAEKLLVNADKKAQYNAALAWMEGAAGVNAQIAALPAVASATIDNQTAIAKVKIDYDKLTQSQKSTVDGANVTKLNNLISKIQGILQSAQIFDVYTESEGGGYELHSSHVSILEAAKTALSEGAVITSDMKNSVPFSGAYVLERNSGVLVYRKTDTGNANIGNNNMLYLYRGNKFIENPTPTPTIYDEINALDDDSVLFHSANGIVACGKKYTQRDKIKTNATINDAARHNLDQWQELMDAEALFQDPFNKAEHVLRLSGTEIKEPFAGNMKFEFYYGVNTYWFNTLIGIYLDFETGEWKFFDANTPSQGSVGGMNLYKTVTYNYEAEGSEQVLATAKKDVFGVWRTNDDLKLMYTLTYGDHVDTNPAVLTLKVLNLTAGTEFTYSVNAKDPNGFTAQGYYARWGANFSGERTADKTTLTDTWSGGYVRNFVLENGLTYKYQDPLGDMAYAYMFGDSAHQVIKSQRISVIKNSSTKNTINVNLDKAGEENAWAIRVPQNDASIDALERDGISLSMIGTSGLTSDIIVWSNEDQTQAEKGLIFESGMAASLRYLVSSSDSETASVSSVSVTGTTDAKFTVTAHKAGSVTITLYIVQHGIMVCEVSFTVDVSNDAVALDSAIAALGSGTPSSVTLTDYDLIYALLAAFDAMDVTAQGDVNNYTDLQTAKATVDQLKADIVIALITGIPAELAIADITDVEEARAGYDSLNAAQKLLVSNYSNLTGAEAKISDADAVAALITALPDDIALENENAVKAADAAFKALSAEKQGLISSALQTKLATAYEDLMGLFAAEVEALVEGIDDDYLASMSFEDLADILYDIINARNAYEVLDSEVKSQFNGEILTKLENLETKVAEAMDAKVTALGDSFGLGEEDNLNLLYYYYHAIPGTIATQFTKENELYDAFYRVLLLKVNPVYDVYIWNAGDSKFEVKASVVSILEAHSIVVSSGAAGDFILERNSKIVVFRRDAGNDTNITAGNAAGLYYFINNRFIGAGTYYASLQATVNSSVDGVMLHSTAGVWAKGTGINTVAAADILKAGENTAARFTYQDKGQISATSVLGYTAFNNVTQVWRLSESRITLSKNTGSSNANFQIYYGANFWNYDYQLGIYMDASGDFRFFRARGATGSAVKAYSYTYEVAGSVIMSATRLPNGEYAPEANIEILYTWAGNVLSLKATNLATGDIYNYDYDIGTPVAAGVSSYLNWGFAIVNSLSWSGSSISNLQLTRSTAQFSGSHDIFFGQQCYQNSRTNNVTHTGPGHLNVASSAAGSIDTFNAEAATIAYTPLTAAQDITVKSEYLGDIDESVPDVVWALTVDLEFVTGTTSTVDLADYVVFGNSAHSVRVYPTPRDGAVGNVLVSSGTDFKLTFVASTIQTKTITINLQQQVWDSGAGEIVVKTYQLIFVIDIVAAA